MGLINPDFETGDLTGWTNPVNAEITSATAHTGTYSLRVFGTGYSNGWIDQYFVPKAEVTLIYWWRKETTHDAAFQTRIWDGVTYKTDSKTFVGNSASTTWASSTLDLTGLNQNAPQWRISFQTVYRDSSTVADFDFDDVSFVDGTIPLAGSIAPNCSLVANLNQDHSLHVGFTGELSIVGALSEGIVVLGGSITGISSLAGALTVGRERTDPPTRRTSLPGGGSQESRPHKLNYYT